MSVRFVTCPSKGPRVDPRAVGCGELGPRCVWNALLAGEATAAFWTPGQAGPAVPSGALRVVRLAGHRSLEIHSSVPHSSMNASLSIVPFLWELHSKRAMVNAREVAEKIGGILGAAFGNPFSSEELFIVIACFSIFTHLSTPPGSVRYLFAFLP